MTPVRGNDERFWELAEEVLVRPGVTKSTMMGFPCLRIDGKFFACCDRATGDLVVKLPEPRVDELLAADRAEPFAPAGRRFREWATVPRRRSRTWRTLLDEALAFVSTQPAPTRRRA
jgi:hypothetical protein